MYGNEEYQRIVKRERNKRKYFQIFIIIIAGLAIGFMTYICISYLSDTLYYENLVKTGVQTEATPTDYKDVRYRSRGRIAEYRIIYYMFTDTNGNEHTGQCKHHYTSKDEPIELVYNSEKGKYVPNPNNKITIRYDAKNFNSVEESWGNENHFNIFIIVAFVGCIVGIIIVILEIKKLKDSDKANREYDEKWGQL